MGPPLQKKNFFNKIFVTMGTKIAQFSRRSRETGWGGLCFFLLFFACLSSVLLFFAFYFFCVLLLSFH